MARAAGVVALVIFFTGATAVLAALSFAVHVAGHSMHPTVKQDDRLFVDFLDRGDPVRFDLVNATVPGVGSVVKRVIGLPGDTVWITVNGRRPTVHVIPAGSDRPHVVTSPTWTDQPRGQERPCCDEDGKDASEALRQVVPEDSYWLLGDNWGGSDDSRHYGFVTDEHIRATLNLRVLPVSRVGPVENPVEMVPAE